MSKPLRLDRLNFATGLKPLMDRARYLAFLNERIAKQLPASLAPHLRVANVRAGILVLHSDSTAWRTRTHYLMPSLIDKLRELPGLEGIVSVQVRVSPASPVRAPTPSRRPHLSDEAIQCLADAAATVADPRLSDSLRRLANRGRRN